MTAHAHSPSASPRTELPAGKPGGDHPSSASLYLRLLAEIRPHWRIVLLALVAAQVAALTEPLFAWLMGPLINVNFSGRALDSVPAPLRGMLGELGLSKLSPMSGQVSPLLVPAMIVLLFTVRGIAQFLNEFGAAWLSNRLVMDLRIRMFERLLNLPSRYYDAHPSGRLLSRFLNDVGNVTQAGVNVITVVVKDSVAVVGQLALMLYLDWRLTLVGMVLLPVAGVSIRRVGKRLRGLNRQQQRANGEMTQVLEESVQGHKSVKVFGAQAYESARFGERANHVRRFGVKQTAASAFNSALMQWLVALALAVVVYYASLRSAAGGMNAGEFMSFITAMLMLSQPVQRLSKANEALQKGLAAAESVFGLIDEVPEEDVGRSTLPTARARGELKFEGVTFRYPQGEREALDRIDLTVAPGELVALVGASGSGKTTLAQLLPRLYDPAVGRILLDGVPIDELPLATLRSQFALVAQDSALFNDTVAANIAYGNAGPVDRARLETVARAAHAWDFIQALPEGFETVIGERGTRLSGGQKQRLSIARALYRDAPVLVLDEATSALDNESERLVQAALDQLMQGRTALVIAHRLSTIERADRILVLQQGAIVESGTHEELLALDNVYARLWRLQFRSETPA